MSVVIVRQQDCEKLSVSRPHNKRLRLFCAVRMQQFGRELLTVDEQRALLCRDGANRCRIWVAGT